MRLAAAVLLAVSLGAPSAPGPRDKCAVCGMFVAGYREWVAQVRFADGKVQFFDGAKDLMKYLYAVPTYAPGRDASAIAEVWVTDYYTVKPVLARDAFYVVGGDVLGPMGRELVPFANEAQARTFAKDHAGERVLRASELTPALVEALDR